jgi:hypothetical protein
MADRKEARRLHSEALAHVKQRLRTGKALPSVIFRRLHFSRPLNPLFDPHRICKAQQLESALLYYEDVLEPWTVVGRASRGEGGNALGVIVSFSFRESASRPTSPNSSSDSDRVCQES